MFGTPAVVQRKQLSFLDRYLTPWILQTSKKKRHLD